MSNQLDTREKAPATKTKVSQDVGLEPREAPARLKKKYKSNEVVVNNKSSFKSHLIKCQQVMDDIRYDNLVIKSVGNATSRALNLALQLNANNFNTFELEPKHYSLKLAKEQKPITGADKDGFNPDEATTLRLKQMSALDIVVRKNKIELDNIRKARSKDK